MSIRTSLAKAGSVFVIAVVVSGCAGGGSGTMAYGSMPAKTSAECRLRPSLCLYEGAYEAGEREYAEQEARRLNRAASARLRRGTGW